ncbi:MAG TPA: helix-turn-helix domain-containing protein [Pantanalinema sp.]
MTSPAALTQVTLAIFRANGRLLEAGDALVAPLNLTSARWQVLGAVALSSGALSAPQIAAAMGVTRQGAQKQLNLLVKDGLLVQRKNPLHARSPLYALSARGAQTYDAAEKLWMKRAEDLAADLPSEALQATLHVLEAIVERLHRPTPAKE